jgi:outer membrane receptor protein involved in Fe transport
VAAAVAPPAKGQGALYETVVSVPRDSGLFPESPRAAGSVTREEMDQRMARSTPEALQEEPGVYVQKTNYGGGAPFIRGQLGNRILLMVDGIRLSNSSYRSGPNQYLNTVDPFLVSHIEVLHGPGSALYGSDAIGGVINVVTELPDGGGEARVNGIARVVGATVDRSGQAGMMARRSGPAAGILAGGSVRRFGTLVTAGGVEQPFTGYDEWSGAVSGVWRPAPGRTAILALHTTRQYDVPRTDRSAPLDFRLFSLQTRELAYLRYIASDLGWADRLRATVSFGRQQEVQDRYRVESNRRNQEGTTVSTLGASVDLRGGAGSRGTWVAGAELYADFFDNTAGAGMLTGPLAADPEGVRYPDGVGYFSTAAFGQYQRKLADRWKVVTDLRLGAVRIALPRDDRLALSFPGAGAPVLEAHRELVPVYAGDVHLQHNPVPWASLNAGAMLGFRAPNVDDYSRLGAEGPGFVTPTRNLRSERALSGELGFKIVRERLALFGYYSYTYIADALGRQAATLGTLTTLDELPVLRVANADSARYHAVEAGARVPVWRRLSAFGSFGYARGEQTLLVSVDPAAPPLAVTEPTTKTPPPFGTAGVGWYAPERRWFAEGVVRYALAQRRLSSTDLEDTRICPDAPGACAGTDGFAVLSLRGSRRVGNFARATVMLENATDVRYRAHASGIDGPGRGLHLALEGWF